MIESITKEPLTNDEAQSQRRGSRYHLDEVNRGAGLLPALLVTGEERRDEGRERPPQNPVLISPAANSTHMHVHFGSGGLDHSERPGLYELLAAAEKADADDGEDELEDLFLPPPETTLPRVLSRSFGLFEYFDLADTVSQGLNAGWTGPKDMEQIAPEGLRKWVHKRAAQAINKRLHSYYRRTLERIHRRNPAVVEVQRKVFAATFGTPWTLFEPELYERSYLVSDLTHYRAAAAALANAPSLAPFRGYREDVHETLEQLDVGNWRGLFSPDGKSYRALNRTLDNLPGGVPHGLLTNLARMRLKEPIRSRSSLAVALIYQSMAGRGPDAPETAFVADPDRIKRAVSIVSRHTHQQLSFRRTADLQGVVRFLLDYPGAHEHRGNIVGLAERSVRWHREEAQNAARRQAQRLGANRQVKRPPVELPAEEGVEFLSTVEQICQEGQFMGNCVGSYAQLAVDGDAYLFHAEYKGKHATAQVDSRGSLVQASGPSNRSNGASKWAARVLGNWGGSFGTPGEPSRGPEEPNLGEFDHLDPIPF